jgi:hypothetical protein
VQGYDVVTSDDHKIGTVVDVRDDCLIVEHGHVFKAKHAIPKAFTSIDDDERIVHATITKDVFTDGPKVTDEWDCSLVLRHYGVITDFEEPDAETDSATTVGAGQGIEPPEAERARIREDGPASTDRPAVHERQANALDPAGDTANLK